MITSNKSSDVPELTGLCTRRGVNVLRVDLTFHLSHQIEKFTHSFLDFRQNWLDCCTSC